MRSHGSLAMNRALMAAAGFDLELLETRTLDGNTQELIYRPSLDT